MMVLYPGDLPQNFIKRLSDLISQFRKVTTNKRNTRKSIAFLYDNNESIKKETRKSIPFTIVSRKFKYRGVNLTKAMQHLYSDICRTLKKEIEEDIRKWKAFLVYGVKEIL